MRISRRNLMQLTTGAALAAQGGGALAQGSGPTGPLTDWGNVRDLFDLSPDKIHMSAMLLASHPRPVREAIAHHRDALDADTVEYIDTQGGALTAASREAAADYLGVSPLRVALTDSTTMSVGLVYNGLQLREDQEVLTTDEDYFVTHVSLEYATRRTGANLRQIPLYDDATNVSADQIVARIRQEIRPNTRVLALTWVHSSTGMKIPVAEIAAALREINAGRDEGDHVLFGLDGVHGFGIETETFFDLGVDFLMAGCHKWLFGPRGTGLAAISERGLAATRPIVPTFDDSHVISAWYTDTETRGSNNGLRMTPGGFKTFEHRWALPAAFALHEEIGRERVATRTHELAGALKDELSAISNVTVQTPRDASMSAGIVAFSVDDVDSVEVVSRLRARNVIASVAPYPSAFVRLTPSIRNTEAEVEQAARHLRDSLSA